LIIRAAARSSLLSRIQVERVKDYLAQHIPGVKLVHVPVKTRGDIVRDKPIAEIGGVGVFEKEVNKLVLEGGADVAVHSMKDLPSRIDPRLEIVMAPPRGPVQDSLVPRRGLDPVDPTVMPQGTIIATGSPRRVGMLKKVNPGLVFKGIRGNLDTRLRKLDDGYADYLVAAEAGLERLGVERPRLVLDAKKYLPSPGQGIIAVVALKDSPIAGLLKQVSHRRTHVEMLAEREFLKTMDTGCSTPIAGYAEAGGNRIIFRAAYYGSEPVFAGVEDADPVEAGRRAAEALRRGLEG